MSEIRVASLVPSATESLFALGLGESVVAVTHECDWPEPARSLPRLTSSAIPEGLEPGEIDRAVRDLTSRGEPIYGLDSAKLAELRPDLIVTQALCAVCAVSYDDVCNVAGGLPGRPDVLSLDPETFGEVISDHRRLAAACGVDAAGEELIAELDERVERVRTSVDGRERPRVIALEWLDPPFIGGHWVPEMIDIAGGVDALGEAGVKSRTATWKEIEAAEPDVVLVMPCGLYVDEAREQAVTYAAQLRECGAASVWAVDAASSFSRPGPRLADGVELLAHLLHPGAVKPPGLGYERVRTGEAT